MLCPRSAISEIAAHASNKSLNLSVPPLSIQLYLVLPYGVGIVDCELFPGHKKNKHIIPAVWVLGLNNSEGTKNYLTLLSI